MIYLKKLRDSGKTIPFIALKDMPNLCRSIQKLLIHEGLLPNSEVADGLYGDRTENALVNYKRKYKLTGGNWIGQTTVEHMISKFPKELIVVESKDDLACIVVKCCLERGYPLNKGLNIIGLEGVLPNGTKNDDAPDRWNDTIGILKYDADNKTGEFMCLYLGTTEPGRYYTVNPLNSGGAARLQLGYHSKLWSFGKHRGYKALVQTGVATLVRDKNRNFYRDDTVTKEEWRGINLHTTKTKGWRGSFNNFIGQWSAGCVVIRKPEEFLKFMSIWESNTSQRSGIDFFLLWRDWL